MRSFLGRSIQVILIGISLFAFGESRANGAHHHPHPPQGGSCTPVVQCDTCTSEGTHTCHVINCQGGVTTFTENCVPPVTPQCNSHEDCDACANNLPSRTCRTIDCYGAIVSTYQKNDCQVAETCSQNYSTLPCRDKVGDSCYDNNHYGVCASQGEAGSDLGGGAMCYCKW